MNTKRKGARAVAEAIAYFVGKGVQVLLPVTDCEKYDLAIDEEGIVKKVQCKYTNGQEKSGAYTVHLRTFGGYREKTYYLQYKQGDFDYLFVYCENGNKYVIPAEKILDRSIISVGVKSWNEFQC